MDVSFGSAWSSWIDAGNFDKVFEAPAAAAVDDVISALVTWRGSA